MNPESKALVRQQVYDLLQDLANQETATDINPTQNMGVNLSQAIKKDGVNIFQIQNVKIGITINKLVQIMKILDEDKEDEPIPVQPKVVSENLIGYNPSSLKEMFQSFFDQQLDVRSVSDIFKVGYIDFLASKLGSIKQAVKVADFGQSSYHVAKKRLESKGIAIENIEET